VAGIGHVQQGHKGARVDDQRQGSGA
jgi:hypothetical protein